MKSIYFSEFLILICFLIINCSSGHETKEDTRVLCQDNEDNDDDGKVDCADEECKAFDICLECIDNDNDQYGTNCSLGEDCDDTSNLCNTTCEDIDNDNVFDCKDDCFDNDHDNYGTGEGCIDIDCDDTIPSCNEECVDTDYDNIYDCNDNCIDLDRDNYGIGYECEGNDCEERNALCNEDCTTDANHNGKRDCDEDCIDNDGDGYGTGAECIGADCDDTSITCNIECVLDTNNNGKRDCDEDCVDKDRDGYGDGEDCEDDCNDDDENNWTLCSQCKDNDNDSYYIMCNRYKTISGPDVDDNNPNCDTEATDNDNDGYCANHDCDDTTSVCMDYCADTNDDGLIDCNDCYNSPHEISHYFTHSQTSDIALKDNYVFLADGTNGLRIIDITDLKNPVETTVFGNDAIVVAVEGNYAYVGGSEGDLYIINITEITSPKQEGIFSTNETLNDIMIKDNNVFLAYGEWGFAEEAYTSGGVEIIDVTDPENPELVSNYDTGGSAHAIEVEQISDNYYAFVGLVQLFPDEQYALTGGWVTIDVTDLTAPVGLNYQDSGFVFSDTLALIDDYLIIGTYNYIAVYDVINPLYPEEVAYIEINSIDTIYSLYSIDNYLFVSGQGLSVLYIDVSSPIEIGSFTLEQGNYNGIIVRDNHAFLSYSYIDWNDPNNVYEGGLSIVSLLCEE